MNTKIAVAVRLAVFLAAAAAAAAAAAILVSTTTNTMPAYAAEKIAADITQGSSSKTIDAFSPNPINLHIGDNVTWTNRDSTPHTVTSGVNGRPDGRFDSSPNFNPLMAPGQTFEHTFTEAGGYPYYCALHPNMIGTVIVAGGGNQTAGGGNQTAGGGNQTAGGGNQTAGGGNQTAGGGNQTAGRELIITGTDEEGNKYEITGISQNATATSFTINSGQSVEIQFDGRGEVELTLPKSVIANITAVQAGTETIQHAAVNENDTSTTISFEVPESQTPVQIMGGFVIPEFPAIAAILAGTIVAVIVLSRFTGSITQFFGRT
jgi:plastocyanin